MPESRIGQNFSGHLLSTNPAGLTEAQDIAYETEIVEGGLGGQTVRMTKSVATKISEIEQSMSDTQLIENIVDQKIGELTIPSAADLNTATTNAQNAATQAQGYSANALSSSSNAQEAFNKIQYGYFIDENRNVVAIPKANTIASINNLNSYEGIGVYAGRSPFAYESHYRIRNNNNVAIDCYFVKSVNEYTDQLDRISEVAETFATGFDADAQFVILSELEYNNLQNKANNTIYFIY